MDYGIFSVYSRKFYCIGLYVLLKRTLWQYVNRAVTNLCSENSVLQLFIKKKEKREKYLKMTSYKREIYKKIFFLIGLFCFLMPIKANAKNIVSTNHQNMIMMNMWKI